MKIAFGMVVLVVSVFLAAPAMAGGWAVTTLDSVPAPTAGQAVEVGFTIRQHGVSPVNPGEEVGIVVRSPGGEEAFFPGEPEGGVGHYVSTVTFPDAGTWTWAVRQGWFSEQALGSIEVAGHDASPALVGDYRWPGWVRFALPTLAVAFGLWAARDLVGVRRRWTLAT